MEWIRSLRFRYMGEGTGKYNGTDIGEEAKLGKIGRWVAGGGWLILTLAIFTVSMPANLGVLWLRLVAGVIALAEAYGYLFSRHSLIGLASFYQYKPTYGIGRRRIVAIISAQILGFLGLAVLIAGQTFGWWHGHYEMHAWYKMLGAFVVFNH